MGDLERHLSTQLGVEAEQHLTHGAATDLTAHLNTSAPQLLLCLGGGDAGSVRALLLGVSHWGTRPQANTPASLNARPRRRHPASFRASPYPRARSAAS